MEIAFIFIILIVVLTFLGYPIWPAITFLFFLMKLISIGSIIMFLVSLVLAILAKPVKARFLRLDENPKHMDHAIYEIDGEEYRNLFPTDWFLKKVLYRKPVVKVRFKKIGRISLVFDPVTLWVIGLGIVLFSGLYALLLMF